MYVIIVLHAAIIAAIYVREFLYFLGMKIIWKLICNSVTTLQLLYFLLVADYKF